MQLIDRHSAPKSCATWTMTTLIRVQSNLGFPTSAGLAVSLPLKLISATGLAAPGARASTFAPM
jgi:hypothetical protein